MRPSITSSTTSHNSSKELISDAVVKAATSSRYHVNKQSTLCQLRISNMKLHGREDDMKLLRGKLLELKNNDDSRKKAKDANSSNVMPIQRLSSDESIASTNNGGASLPEIILVSGVSGVGKSALVMKGLKDPATKMGLTFISGKFDMALPMSAFCDAMASLAKIIMEGSDKEKIKGDIKETLEEDDVTLLVRALPGCDGLFPTSQNNMLEEQDNGDDNNNPNKMIGKDAISRLQYLIRQLLKIMCSHLKGLVFFMDDLQWSDIATLDLLQNISLDSELQSLLLVGAYREDEVPENHPLAIRIREKEQMGIAITTINIGNLTLASVTSLIAEALGMEDDEETVRPLAATVHKKTDGNAFFVLMFLRSLHDEQMLQFNIGAFKWTWDMEAVDAKLATENVATMMVNKLRRLNRKTQSVLKIASCLGARFSQAAVAAVVDNLSFEEEKNLSLYMKVEEDDILDESSVSSLGVSIKELKGEGIFEKDETENIWHFAHDKIQLAALELISDGKRETFRGKVGDILLRKLDPQALEMSLFEVVSLRNCQMASIIDKAERIELAKLNLRAARKATANAAFDSAAVYYKAGREALGSNGWDIDRVSMLSLCSEGANTCYIIGDSETSSKLVAEVIRQDSTTIDDKYIVYDVKVKAHYGASEFDDALNAAFDYRKQLGLPTLKNSPVSKLKVVKEFIATKRLIGKRSPEDLAGLPDLTNERIVQGNRMLELALTTSFIAQPTLFPLIVFLLVKETLNHGINASSCDAFGAFGIILCALGKFKEGMEMSKAVHLMLAKSNMSRMRSRSRFVCEGFIHHWLMPLHSTLTPLLESYQIGLRIGDIESAAQSIMFRSNHLYWSGRPLGELVEEFQASIGALANIRQDHRKMANEAILCTIQKLRGVNTDTDMERLLKIALETSNQTLRAFIYLMRMDLGVYFCNWGTAAEILVEAGDLKKVAGGLFGGIRVVIVQGLISIHAAQDAQSIWKRRKWKRKALLAVKQIRSWVQKGAVNIVHNLYLLTAELAALEGKHSKAEENYKSAITVATRNGFLHDKALSHELAWRYFDKRGDNYWANYHRERCQESYSDWGATAKVDSLRRAC